VARDTEGALAAALRLARRFGSQDVVFDLAKHGSDDGPGLPPQVREFEDLIALEGRGRIGVGRFSLPWQLRAQSAKRRGGEVQQALAGRIAMPLADWQAAAAFGVVREGDGPWQGNADLGLSGRAGQWRLRGGIDARIGERFRLGGARLDATRTMFGGSMAIDLRWDAQSGALGGGIALNRQFGDLGVSGSVGYGREGVRAGIAITLGLWRDGPRWRTARSGISRSGAVIADMFVDEDGDGLRGPGDGAVEGGRFLVGSAVRAEETGPDGKVLIRGLPAGPEIDVETQLASLPDFTLRPARAGDRLVLRTGEVRRLAVPLRPTGSVEAQVLLQAGERRVPRSGIEVTLLDMAGEEVARQATDFAGYVLFDGLPFGRYRVKAAGQGTKTVSISREAPDSATSITILPVS
jgi:hypothetical protein